MGGKRGVNLCHPRGQGELRDRVDVGSRGVRAWPDHFFHLLIHSWYRVSGFESSQVSISVPKGIDVDDFGDRVT